MPAVAGDLQEISINNVTYPVTSDTDASRALGGFENEVLPNGDGSARLKKMRRKWRIGGMSVACDDAINNDQKNLQDVADSKEFIPVVMYMADGSIFSGTGQIEGELNFSNQNAACTFDLAGPQKLVRQ
jgi:hypothetical protein